MHTRTPGRHGDRVSYGGAQYFQLSLFTFEHVCHFTYAELKAPNVYYCGSSDGTSFISPFWHLEFVGGFQILGKIVGCDESRMASYAENGETEAGGEKKKISTRFMSSENIDRNKIKLA